MRAMKRRWRYIGTFAQLREREKERDILFDEREREGLSVFRCICVARFVLEYVG